MRPSVFLVHYHMNVLYQFWIHTELVDSMGILELVLNTPSHHRVHHGKTLNHDCLSLFIVICFVIIGRNPYCIDKNYAGVLIIWDRMFGTFQREKTEEELAYGLVHPIETFDPVYIQVIVFLIVFDLRMFIIKIFIQFQDIQLQIFASQVFYYSNTKPQVISTFQGSR